MNKTSNPKGKNLAIVAYITFIGMFIAYTINRDKKDAFATARFEPDWDDAADQDSTATPWSLSNSAAVVDPTVYLAVAPTRACEWCWSPEAPLCSDCMISMKQKKGRALDVDARWRLTGASDDISEEAQRQMSRDAQCLSCLVPSMLRPIRTPFSLLSSTTW